MLRLLSQIMKMKLVLKKNMFKKKDKRQKLEKSNLQM